MTCAGTLQRQAHLDSATVLPRAAGGGQAARKPKSPAGSGGGRPGRGGKSRGEAAGPLAPTCQPQEAAATCLQELCPFTLWPGAGVGAGG